MKRLAILAAAGLGLLLATPVSAKVIDRGPSSFVTRNSLVVSATPREAWLALIEPGKWWSSGHSWSGDASNMTLTPQAGGCFCERIPAVETRTSVGLEGSAQHMVVVQAFPDKALRMRGGLGPLQSEPAQGVLTITLQKVDEGTRVTFEYIVGGTMRYDTAEISKAVDGVMSQQLGNLALLLGKVDVPEPTEKSPVEGAAPVDAAKAEDEKENAQKPKEPARVTVDDAFGDIE